MARINKRRMIIGLALLLTGATVVAVGVVLSGTVSGTVIAGAIAAAAV